MSLFNLLHVSFFNTVNTNTIRIKLNLAWHEKFTLFSLFPAVSSQFHVHDPHLQIKRPEVSFTSIKKSSSVRYTIPCFAVTQIPRTHGVCIKSPQNGAMSTFRVCFRAMFPYPVILNNYRKNYLEEVHYSAICQFHHFCGCS